MQRGLSLTELAAKITANQSLKHDLIANTETLTMTVQNDGKTSLEVPEQGNFPILPLAHTQIGTRLDIPKRYYDRCLSKDPALLAHNVNTWFRQDPERRMLRTLGGDVRAFLSNRYQRIENEQIAEAALPVLADIPGVQFPSCEVTDRRLHIHFVVPSIQAEVKVGDIVQAGGVISNSEVGYGAVSVAGLIWRLWCLNGARTEDTFSRHHVGRLIDDNTELWAEDTVKADDKAVLLKVRDMVKAVIDEARFKVKIDKLKGLAEAKLTGDVIKSVEVLAQHVRATEEERKGILQSLIEGGDLSAWGLVNAVTAQAHKGDYDRATELTAAGGALIDLPPDQWKRMLEVEA